MRTLVLASASPARLRLLQMAGVDPAVRVSDVDEAAVLADFRASPGHTAAPTSPEIADLLAAVKAHAVAFSARGDPQLSAALVVGCDSMLEWNGQAWGKPENADAARKRLRAMRGTSGILHTGHCVIDLVSGRALNELASTVVHFGSVSDAEIDAYVATGEPLNVAGSFTLDGLSAPFIDGIEGDPSNVIGLSLPLLRRLLRDLGVAWPDLWRHDAKPPEAAPENRR